MTQLKDVIHLYLGCDITLDDGSVHTLSGAFIESITNDPLIVLLDGVMNHYRYSDGCKLVLRRLSSMTEEEKIGLLELHHEYIGATIFRVKFHEQKHFDKLERYPSIGFRAQWKHNDKVSDWMGTISFSCLNPAQFTYLLSKHFDLFGLIENGFALDQETLKQ